MVVEFLGSQTLKDFHLAIVELADDELWWRKIQKKTASGGAEASRTAAADADRDEPTDSGFFFLEGIFYTHGPADYVTPIQQWLQSGDAKQRRERAEHLGLHPPSLLDEDLPVKRMADVRLEDVALRLGVRYVHVHHGDVECSVFLTDRRLAPKLQFPYPLVRDIWTQPDKDCDVCGDDAPAFIATSTECEITRGHRALCDECARQLQLHVKAPNHIERYTIWRGSHQPRRRRQQPALGEGEETATPAATS